VDTCAAEFEALTYYSTYEEESRVLPSSKQKVMILGGGPNRVGRLSLTIVVVTPVMLKGSWV